MSKYPYIATSNAIYDWPADGRQQGTADPQAVAGGVQAYEYTARPAAHLSGAPHAVNTPSSTPTPIPNSHRAHPYARAAAAHGHPTPAPRPVPRRRQQRQIRRDFMDARNSGALGHMERGDPANDAAEAWAVALAQSRRRHERARMDYNVAQSFVQPSTSSARDDTPTAPVPAQPEPVVDDEQLFDEPMDLSEDEWEDEPQSASGEDGAEVEDAAAVEDIGVDVPTSDEAAASAHTGASVDDEAAVLGESGVDDETSAAPSTSSTHQEPLREEVDLYERLHAALASGRVVDTQRLLMLWEQHRERIRRRKEELIARIRAARDVMEAVVDEKTLDEDAMDVTEDPEDETASGQDGDQGAEVEFDEDDEQDPGLARAGVDAGKGKGKDIDIDVDVHASASDDEPFEDPELARAEVDAGKGKGKDIDIDVDVHASASLYHDGVDASDEEAVVHRSVVTWRAESTDQLDDDDVSEARDDSAFASASGSHDGAASTETDDGGGLKFDDNEFDASSADAPSPTSSDSSESTVRDTTPRPEERPTPMTEAQRAHAELLSLLKWVEQWDECTLRNRPPATVISVICGSRAIETLKVERIVNEDGVEDEDGLVITVVDSLKRVRTFKQCDTGTLAYLYMAPSIYECKNVVLGDTLGHEQYYAFDGLQLPLATDLKISMTGTADAQVWDLADNIVLDMPGLKKITLSAAQRVSLPADKIDSFARRNLAYECDCDPGCYCERNRAIPVVRQNVVIPGLEE